MSKALDKLVISEYARREEISVQEAERRFQKFISVIADCLLQIGRVNLRTLGVFHTAKRKNAKFRNHHTGMTEVIPMIRVLKFKPSKTFKQLLNDKTKQNLQLRFKS